MKNIRGPAEKAQVVREILKRAGRRAGDAIDYPPRAIGKASRVDVAIAIRKQVATVENIAASCDIIVFTVLDPKVDLPTVT